jgi:hypothetical protein
VLEVDDGATTVILGGDGGRIVIDFEMDHTDTGPTYKGPAIHTFGWFVDPVLASSELPDFWQMRTR